METKTTLRMHMTVTRPVEEVCYLFTTLSEYNKLANGSNGQKYISFWLGTHMRKTRLYRGFHYLSWQIIF